MKKHYRFSSFGFGFGFPPFGFRFWGPWRAGPWPFPRREEYLHMLEEYKEYLEECKRDIEEELEEVEKEIEELRR